jgi:carbon monoxide dehydrogenase subunit G
MAIYNAHVNAPQSIEKVFEYLSEFQSVADWDPGVVRARKLTEGSVALGTMFEVVVSFLGVEMPLRYEVIGLDPPRRIVLRADAERFTSIDDITFESRGPATRVTYDANISLKGIAALGEPLLSLVFRRIGDRADAGLGAALGSR